MGGNMNRTITALLNTQIQKEFEAAYNYIGFAAFFDKKGLSGFSKWYRVQAEEEKEHAMKIYDYLCRINQPIELLPVPAPKYKLENIEQVLKLGLEHEEYITGLITTIYIQAEKEQDFFTKNFLEWFIREQFEEEESAKILIEKYSNFGITPQGLYILDREMGTRSAR